MFESEWYGLCTCIKYFVDSFSSVRHSTLKLGVDSYSVRTDSWWCGATCRLRNGAYQMWTPCPSSIWSTWSRARSTCATRFRVPEMIWFEQVVLVKYICTSPCNGVNTESERESAYELRLPELDYRAIIVHLLIRVHERAQSSFRVREVKAEVLVAIAVQQCVCVAAAELYAAVPEKLVLFGEAERRKVVGLQTVLEENALADRAVRRLRFRVGHSWKKRESNEWMDGKRFDSAWKTSIVLLNGWQWLLIDRRELACDVLLRAVRRNEEHRNSELLQPPREHATAELLERVEQKRVIVMLREPLDAVRRLWTACGYPSAMHVCTQYQYHHAVWAYRWHEWEGRDGRSRARVWYARSLGVGRPSRWCRPVGTGRTQASRSIRHALLNTQHTRIVLTVQQSMRWEWAIWPLEVSRTEERVVEAIERVGSVGCRVGGYLVTCKALPPTHILGEQLGDIQCSVALEITKQHVEVVGAKKGSESSGVNFFGRFFCTTPAWACFVEGTQIRIISKITASHGHGLRSEFEYAMPNEHRCSKTARIRICRRVGCSGCCWWRASRSARWFLQGRRTNFRNPHRARCPGSWGYCPWERTPVPCLSSLLR